MLERLVCLCLPDNGNYVQIPHEYTQNCARALRYDNAPAEST